MPGVGEGAVYFTRLERTVVFCLRFSTFRYCFILALKYVNTMISPKVGRAVSSITTTYGLHAVIIIMLGVGQTAPHQSSLPRFTSVDPETPTDGTAAAPQHPSIGVLGVGGLSGVYVAV
jgi:hypothetical protein